MENLVAMKHGLEICAYASKALCYLIVADLS
jgi:hypothetical protein